MIYTRIQLATWRFVAMLPAALLLTMPFFAAAEEGEAKDVNSLDHYRTVLADKSHHLKIVALGDSNTEVNWTSEGQLNWVGLLQAGLFESGHACRYTVVNAGISGSTFVTGAARLDRDVLAYDPDLVIVCFGTNDAMMAVPLEESEKSLREIIDRVHGERGVSILLRTPQPNFDPNEGKWAMDAELETRVEMIRRVAAERGIALVDHYAGWLGEDGAEPARLHAYDTLHPNGRGHRRLYTDLSGVLGLTATFRWDRAGETE